MRLQKGKLGQSRRRNFVFSDRAMERLVRLVQKTDASSDTEVIKKALLTYEALVNWLESGAVFCIKEPDGQVVPLDLLIDVVPEEAKPSIVPVDPDEEADDYVQEESTKSGLKEEAHEPTMAAVGVGNPLGYAS